MLDSAYERAEKGQRTFSTYVQLIFQLCRKVNDRTMYANHFYLMAQHTLLQRKCHCCCVADHYTMWIRFYIGSPHNHWNASSAFFHCTVRSFIFIRQLNFLNLKRIWDENAHERNPLSFTYGLFRLILVIASHQHADNALV